MKKLYTQPHYIRHNTKHARKLMLRSVISKKKLKARNKGKLNQGRLKSTTVRDFEQIEAAQNKVTAPKVLSMISNTKGTIRFINELYDSYKKKESVWVDLENVEVLRDDAIVVLLSIMVEFKVNNIFFNGNFPKNIIAKKILEDSGFFQHLFKEKLKGKKHYSFGYTHSIYTNGTQRVDQMLSASIIDEASYSIWGQTRRCQDIQSNFMELMQNTNNHADPKKMGKEYWWLSVNHFKEEKRVSFSFVDFGVGVFKSLENKTPDAKFYGWATKLKQLFNFENNADLLKIILEGGLHKSYDIPAHRGKGLPSIYESMKGNAISNLYIITNDVLGDVSNDKYTSLPTDFSGTFVYWEVNENNWSTNAKVKDSNR